LFPYPPLFRSDRDHVRTARGMPAGALVRHCPSGRADDSRTRPGRLRVPAVPEVPRLLATLLPNPARDGPPPPAPNRGALWTGSLRPEAGRQLLCFFDERCQVAVETSVRSGL